MRQYSSVEMKRKNPRKDLSGISFVEYFCTVTLHTETMTRIITFLRNLDVQEIHFITARDQL